MTVEDVPDYQISLPEFEGPLDLLLHLVKKHELSILDIPIAFITEQYLKMLDLMRALNLEVAGDYLVMAATLAHLKSRELVPPDPADEAALDESGGDEGEVGDPKQELIRRLLEYQKYKEAAAQLAERPVVGRNVWPRGASAEQVAGLHAIGGQAPLAEVPVIRLIELLEDVLSRARVTLTHDVLVDRLTITDRINEMVDRLVAEGAFTFESCFAFVEAGGTLPQLRNQIVVTFLALLEMTRLRMVRLTQAEERGQIYVTRAVEDLRAEAARLSDEGEKDYT
jgi:segregation and condensation protein A